MIISAPSIFQTTRHHWLLPVYSMMVLWACLPHWVLQWDSFPHITISAKVLSQVMLAQQWCQQIRLDEYFSLRLGFKNIGCCTAWWLCGYAYTECIHFSISPFPQGKCWCVVSSNIRWCQHSSDANKLDLMNTFNLRFLFKKSELFVPYSSTKAYIG